LDEELVERFIKGCKSKNLYNALIAFSINEDKKLNDLFSLLNMLYQKKSELLVCKPQNSVLIELKL